VRRPILIQACVNGARPPAIHPALPVTPAQTSDDVRAVVRAGADAVHLHAKGEDGLDTFDPDTVDAVITSCKVVAPGLPISITTGAWALPDPAERVAAIRAWTVLPDVASVNWHEVGSAAVADVLMEREIGIEAGLWTLDDVGAWAESPVRDEVRRVLLELPDVGDEAETLATAQQMIEGVREASPHMPILLHGEGASAWTALRHALRLGLQTRIGFEDTLQMPDGTQALDNAALVRRARMLADELG